MKTKKGKWCAYHTPTKEEEYIFGETKKEVVKKLNNLKCFCGKKKCESLLAEWFILKTESMFEAQDFGDILSGAGFKKIK